MCTLLCRSRIELIVSSEISVDIDILLALHENVSILGRH